MASESQIYSVVTIIELSLPSWWLAGYHWTNTERRSVL